MLAKKEILNTLALYKEQNSHELGIEEIGLFGSYAKEEAKESSDIDIYVKLKRSNLFLLSRIRIDLEEIFGKHVDIVEVRESMNNYLKKQIEKESIST